MSILKTTSFQILSASMAGQSEHTFKTAHRAEFDHVERRPGYLYVRSRAISSRINENFDGFDADEIAKGYQTFMGKPVFVSHHNSNHRRARGAIVAVALHKDVLASGEPDTWVEVLMEVDAIHFPKLAQAIIAGEIARTSMGCFVPGTPITLADGTKKPIEEIVLGDEVLTHTGQIEPVTYVMEREYRGTTYEVHSYGQSAPMVLTEEHPVWVERNGTPQWVEAAQLSTDDWVLTPALRGMGKPGEASFARLLGLYLAEGNFGYDRKRHGDTPTFVEWNYHVEEREFIEETISLLQELGYSPVGPYIKNNCATVRVNSAELAERFLHHGGMHSWAKKVSTEVMNWEPEVQKLVVTGWLDGDGCYRKNRVEVGTVSEDLAYQMYALGLRTGIPFTPPTKQHSPSAQKLGKRPKWVLQAVLFPSLRGDDFSSWGRRMSEEGQWRKITHIESHAFTGTVYNFDVEGDDSYVASDCAVHNCDVAYSMCTFCGSKAYTEAEYCKHIPRMKGKRIRRVDAKTGASSMVLVAEQCFGLHFFENSLLVEDPADPSAFCLGTDWVDSDMTPHHASANSMDSSIAYAEAIANIPQRELSTTSASSPDRNLGKQVSLDDEDFFFGQHVSSIAYTGSATPPLHHVGRVVGVGTEQPVGRIVAERNIAGMANDQSFGDRADELLVTPSVGADGASFSVGQREASVARVESTTGPEPAFVLTTDGDLRPVALNLAHGGLEASQVIGVHVPYHSTFEAGFILTAADNELPELKMPPPPYRVNCRNCGQQSVTNKNHPKCESCGDLHVSPVRRASKEAATQEEAERTGPCPHCGGKLFSNGFPGTSPYCGSCQTHIPLKPRSSSFGGARVASLHKRAEDICGAKYGPNDSMVCQKPKGHLEPDHSASTIWRKAINETIAPPEVDTLRESECPICFTAETLIRTEEGYVPIASIEVGDRVLSSDGEFHVVQEAVENDYDGILYSIKTGSMIRPVLVTPDHPFRTLVGHHPFRDTCEPGLCAQYGEEYVEKRGFGEEQHITHHLDWIPVRDLTSQSFVATNVPQEDIVRTDRIVVPDQYLGSTDQGRSQRKGPDSFALTEDFLWILGLYIAEGSNSKRHLTFTLHEKEIEYAERVLDFARGAGYTANILPANGKAINVEVYSSVLAEWLPALLGHGSHNKAIPQELMSLPPHQMKALIAGIMAGDGYTQSDRIKQTSPTLALQLAEISIQTGITPGVSFQSGTSRGKKDSYSVLGVQERRKRSPYWEIEGHMLTRVRDIHPVPYAGKVYNLSVEGDPTYTVQNILVHNCGSDAYNGEECPVCMFIKPPDMFMDPDIDAAQNADLRQDQAQEGLAVSDQVGNDHLQGQTPVGDDLMAAGQEGDLQCDSCGAVQPGQASAGTDPAVAGGQPPATPADPAIPNAGAPTPQPTSQPPTQPGAEPPPPVNDESMPLAQGPPSDDDVPPAGKELPKPKDGENDDGQDDGSKPQSKPKGDPADKGKVESDIDAGNQDSTKPTEDQAVDALQQDLKPGDPCPVCDGQGKLQPKSDDKKDDQQVEDKDAKDDKDGGPPWQKGDNSSKEVKASSSFNHDTPGVSDMAAPTVKVLASHQAEIRRLKAENAQLRRSVNYIAAAVGITRFADENDPANPVPQPAGGAPSQTSEEVMNAATRVNVQDIGSTPVTDVNADATTTVDQVGGINADTPYSINTEVTTPVSGTETRIPLDQVRTLPEIQFGNPLVPDTAFPLEGPFAEKATLGSKGRTYAALRLARLRKAAGTDETGQDDLVLANTIDTNASLSDGAISQEIDILTRVVTATQAPTPRQASRRLVPQSSGGIERTTPSVAVNEGLTQFTSAASSDDDAFAFCD